MNSETIKTGISVTQKAIQENNPAELGRCIARFKALDAKVEDVETALLRCPANLLFQAGYDLIIRSPKLAADITLREAINMNFGGAA
jgi:hypothetical protein